MIKTLSLTVGLALLAAPISAQRMGSSNSKAPTCSQTIKFANGAEITMKYQAITWADGKTMKGLSGADAGGMRDRVNKTAAARPLGSVKTSTDLNMSGRTIKAGEYDMFFTVMENDGNLMWLCNLRAKGNADAEALRWRLALQPSEQNSSRLTIALTAGEGDNDAGVYLAFGKEFCTVDLSCAEKKGEK